MKTILSLACFFQFMTQPEPFTKVRIYFTPIVNVQDQQDKINALTVLRNKCNGCHADKKRLVTFTQANMDSLAADIWEQVFVKKKMPKGRKNKLTPTELQQLRNWLALTLNLSSKKHQ